MFCLSTVAQIVFSRFQDLSWASFVSSCGKRAARTPVRASGEIDRTTGATRVRNTNLFDSLSDGGHRLKIVGLVSPSDLIELINGHRAVSPRESLAGT